CCWAMSRHSDMSAVVAASLAPDFVQRSTGAAVHAAKTMGNTNATQPRMAPFALGPAQDDADITRHAARIVDDLVADVVAARPELALPEVIDLLGNPRQRPLPALLGLVDGAPVVAAKRMREPIDLNPGLAVLHGAVHDDCRLLDDLVIGKAG